MTISVFFLGITIIGVLFLILGICMYLPKVKFMRRLKAALQLAFFILGSLFLLAATFFFGLSAAILEPNPVGRMRVILPQVHEDFATVQPNLEILRNELAQHSASISMRGSIGMASIRDSFGMASIRDSFGRGCVTQRLQISYNALQPGASHERVTIYFADWNTIEWLSPDAKAAIIFLTSSQDITRNFSRIFAQQVQIDDEHHIYATLSYGSADAQMIIYYSPAHWGRFVHYEDIGSGYMLAIEHSTVGSTLVWLFAGAGGVMLLIALNLLIIGMPARRFAKRSR